MAARAYIGGRDPVAPGVGDRPLSPVGGGRQAPFFSGTSLRIWRKKITLLACRPMGGDRGVFLKYCKTDIYFWNFYFFLNIKKKKALAERGQWLGPLAWRRYLFGRMGWKRLIQVDGPKTSHLAIPKSLTFQFELMPPLAAPFDLGSLAKECNSYFSTS